MCAMRTRIAVMLALSLIAIPAYPCPTFCQVHGSESRRTMPSGHLADS
jgi:hypothetical protein